MSRWISVFALLSLSAAPLTQTSTAPDGDLFHHATTVLQRALNVPESAIPAATMSRARAIAVFPKVWKDESIYFGTGVLSARGGLRDAWTPPAIVAIQGRLPIELEVEAIDLILIALTPNGLNYLTRDRYASPVLWPIHPGTLGRNSRPARDADLVAYMTFANFFAGVTIEDWEITALTERNKSLYGYPYSTFDLAYDTDRASLPSGARDFVGTLMTYFRRES